MVIAAASVGACSKSSDTSQAAAAGAPPAAASSPGVDSGSSTARSAAKAAYDSAERFEISTFATMKATASDFAAYMTSPAVDPMAFLLNNYRKTGVVYKGTPTWQSSVTAVDMMATPPRVTLSVCFASNGWGPVFKKSGKPVLSTTQSGSELEIVAVVAQHGKWLVCDVSQQDKPC
jgi:hypothetical protein